VVAVEDQFGSLVTSDSSAVTLKLSSGTFSTGRNTATAIASGGVATFNNLIINTVGTYTLAASDSTLTGATSGNIVVTGPASKLVYQQAPPATVTAGVDLSPVVTVAVEDKFGKVVTGDSSTVTVTLSSGTFSNGSKTATSQAVNGVATFSGLTINISGTYTITASDGTLTTVKSGNIMISPAAASQLIFQSIATTGTAGTALATAVKVAVEDQFGNIVTGDSSTVTLSVAAGPGGFAGGSTLSVAAVNGVATFSNLILNTTGKYTLNAADGSLTVPTSGTISINPAAATQLVLQQTPTTGTAGVALAPAVKVAVEDQFGNIVTTSSTVTLTLSSGTFSTGSTTVSAATSAGIATFSNVIINIAGTYTLSASDALLTGASSGNITISVAAASKLVFQQAPPATGTAGVALSPAVTVAVEDKFGNVVATDSSTVTLTLSSGTFANGSKTIAVQVVNGVATFSSLIINKAGAYTITASDGTLTTVKSANIVIS
jgi:hypothetical protein